MPLTADERRILAMLATAGLNDVMRPLLIAQGFGVPLIAGLVNRGLATIEHAKVRADGKLVAVARVRITDAGQDALTAED
jgi:hypothetical protein